MQSMKSKHSSTVRSVEYSPDGALIASGSGDRTVKLWDPKTGVLSLVGPG